MAQYINIFVILVNLECTMTHYYYEGCDNIYIYIYIERERERERERCYVHNIFITNYRWLVVIGSNLKLTLWLLFCPNNNNQYQPTTSDLL